MRRSRHLEFANFICRFGDRLVLLDLAEEVVIPAFLDATLRREFGETKYFFYSVELVELRGGDSPVLAVAGRLVKDTVIEREQVFVPDRGLVSDEQRLASAPSAVFVLILNNHRLLYFAETADAPGLTSFRATSETFIREKHEEYIRALYLDLKDEFAAAGQRLTLAALRREYPGPDVEVVPLGSEASLQQFLEQFQLLDTVVVELLEPNNEADNNEFFRMIREAKNDIGSVDTALSHHNRAGLSKEVAAEQLGAAVQQGNSRISLHGKDTHGDVLSGNEEQFKIRVPFPEQITDVASGAARAYQAYEELQEGGILEASDGDTKSRGAVQRLLAHLRFRKPNGGG